MGPAPSRHDTGHASLSPQRSLVLEELQRSESTTTVGALATQLALHVNTVRKHLDGLVERQLVTRERAAVNGRGRPAWQYAAATQRTEPDHRVRDYAGLATALAGQLSRSSANPRSDAISAGEAWGRVLVEGAPAGTPAHARREVIELLDELGFAPRPNARATTAQLLRCPLLDAARAQPDVVCPVHLGIVRGALTELGGDPQRAELLPFSEPGACRLHLHRAPAG